MHTGRRATGVQKPLIHRVDRRGGGSDQELSAAARLRSEPRGVTFHLKQAELHFLKKDSKPEMTGHRCVDLTQCADSSESTNMTGWFHLASRGFN